MALVTSQGTLRSIMQVIYAVSELGANQQLPDWAGFITLSLYETFAVFVMVRKEKKQIARRRRYNRNA